MNNLKDIIVEKLKINKETSFKDIKSMIDEIDVSKFKWYSAYSDDDYQRKCKNETREFADEVYANLKPIDRIVQLYKDTAKKYYSSTTKLNQSDIDKQYDYDIRYINLYGWSYFESMSLEQGWWAFIYWLKNKI